LMQRNHCDGGQLLKRKKAAIDMTESLHHDMHIGVHPPALWQNGQPSLGVIGWELSSQLTGPP
jgi:hypothetical protein